MFRTAPKAAERFSNVIFTLVYDIYTNREARQAHEEVAAAAIDDVIRRCNNLSPEQLRRIPELFKIRVDLEIDMATDFSGVEINRATSQPRNMASKAKLDEAHAELNEEANKYFDSVWNNSSLKEKAASESKATSRKRIKSSGGTRKRKHNKK